MNTRTTLLAAAALVAMILATPTAARAAIDCSKIHAYYCPVSSGGPYIKGDKGAVRGGATVTVTDASGHSATTTANADGSFSLNATSTSLVMPVGTVLTVKVGEESCEITVERCPPIGTP